LSSDGPHRVFYRANGSGHADILSRNTVTRNTVIWQMNGLTRQDDRSIGSPVLDWQVQC
jgi:hypothetical protein